MILGPYKVAMTPSGNIDFCEMNYVDSGSGINYVDSECGMNCAIGPI